MIPASRRVKLLGGEGDGLATGETIAACLSPGLRGGIEPGGVRVTGSGDGDGFVLD